VRRLTLIGALLAVVVLLAAAQLVLPGIAAQRLRDRLARSGSVISVRVSAFPAVELLWHHADRVTVRMAAYRSATSGLDRLLAEAVDVGSLDASATELDVGLLTLRDVRLRKRGDVLSASARVSEADLRAALPVLDDVTPVASPQGTLTLRGTATLFGVTATVDATVAVRDGTLVVSPDVPFGGLATVTVFADPHLRVSDVSASPFPGGFRVRARGTLR
jgi:hypothetical protein